MPESPRLILIVEDDRDIRENLREFLEDEGYRTQLASNGSEALELLDRAGTPPDLILLDLMMPVLDGWAFRARQQQSPHARIPVVAFTASGRASRDIDVDAVVSKPVELATLLATVERLCARVHAR